MYNNESIYTKSQSWWTRQIRRNKKCNNIPIVQHEELRP